MSVWQTVSSASSSGSVGGGLRGRPSTSARNCASATVPKWPPRLKLPLKPGASAGSSPRAPSAQQDLAHLSATRTSLRVWRSSTRTPDAHAVRTLYAGNVHQTRSHIFYKYEGVSPPGSHKPNTAVAQAYYNKKEGRTRLSTETGAGQWGSALSFACKLIGLECKVYMVRVSYEQKPARRSMIKAWGAEIVPSPSDETQSGRAILEEHPDSPGSLGIAISEAVEDAAGRDDR